ncbi:MAG: hypothetical protein VXX61_02905 [Asgard group archaeon]|jgi:hypothetical protein|nr:hypothetical protein [Asgard group archaeon]|tara:strand:- start:244 stop:1080 length:837 start_codon:yes stop_codon:yes gene_type:complete
MSILFDSLNTRNLDQIFEINLNQYFRLFANNTIENSGISEGDYSVQISSGLNHPDFNAVVQTNLLNNFDEIKNDVDTFFNNTNLPYTWFITPNNEKMGLYKELLEHKYRYIGYDMIVGVELNNIIRNIKTPNSLYIEEVNSKEKLEIWGELFIKSRNMRGITVSDFNELFKTINFKEPYLFKKYIGWLNGEPICGSTLILGGGIAVIYDQTVLPKYKDFGIYEAINVTPLKKAKEMGFKLGLAVTSIGDLKRLTGIGFKELFNVKKMVKLNELRRRRR